jgi:hypothetical protein
MQQLKIAVDFDGTIVENAYPYIGRELPFAFQTLKMLQKEGHLLVLWTRRSEKMLEQAIEFCSKNGIEFYAVNKSYPEEIFDENESRKIEVDLFIDDRIVGGFPGWGLVYQHITGQGLSVKKTKSNFIKMLFR